MQKESDVYTIPADDILESLKKEFGVTSVPIQASAPQAAVLPGPGRIPAETVIALSIPRPGPASRGAAPTATIEYAGAPAVSRSRRAPIAASLSLFVCGAGQLVNRQFKLGMMMFLLVALGISAHWSMAMSRVEILEVGGILGFGPGHLAALAGGLDLLILIVIPASVYQAYRMAEANGASFQGFRLPIASSAASLLVPGFGQILNAQIGKAVTFLFFGLSGAGVAAWFLFPPLAQLIGVEPAIGTALGRMPIPVMVYLGLAGLIWLLGVYDAFLVANQRRRSA